jgi:hypothetical protein
MVETLSGSDPEEMEEVLSGSDHEEMEEVLSGWSPLQIALKVEGQSDTEAHDEGYDDGWFMEDWDSASSDGSGGNTMGTIPSI